MFGTIFSLDRGPGTDCRLTLIIDSNFSIYDKLAAKWNKRNERCIYIYIFFFEFLLADFESNRLSANSRSPCRLQRRS